MKLSRAFSALALVSALLLSGCASTATSETAPDAGNSSSGKASDSLASETTSNGNSDRSVIKTASLGLETKAINDSKNQLTAIAKRFGGLVENWSQQSNNAGELWSVAATVRVPVASLDKAIDDISKLGDVLSLDISNTDVTSQVLDIDARINSLSASVERLRNLMANASNTGDLLAAESALSQRQAELESLLSQQAYLKNAVDLATIYVSVYAEGLGPVSAPTSFLDGLNEGWKALTLFFTGTIVFLGMVAPWLLVIVPVGAIVYVVVRKIQRRG